jgi:phosphoribosylformylglycinamidine synthase subunit PurS
VVDCGRCFSGVNRGLGGRRRGDKPGAVAEDGEKGLEFPLLKEGRRKNLQKRLARAEAFSTIRRWRAFSARAKMKAKIIVTPKKAVVDPQGKTVQNALAHLGYQGIGDVHVGKYLEIELTGADKEAWRRQIDEACLKILSNPVIEDYRFDLE